MMVAGRSSGSFFFSLSFFRHFIAPQLHASLNTKVRGQAESHSKTPRKSEYLLPYHTEIEPVI